MYNIPHNTIPVQRPDDIQWNDTGKSVIVNSAGGPTWPDNRWKRGLTNTKGIVTWGPFKLCYTAMGKVLDKQGKPIIRKGQCVLKMQRYETVPYWSVLLDGFDLELLFAEKELQFN